MVVVTVTAVAELAEVTAVTRDGLSWAEVAGALFSCWVLFVLTSLDAGTALPKEAVEWAPALTELLSVDSLRLDCLAPSRAPPLPPPLDGSW